MNQDRKFWYLGAWRRLLSAAVWERHLFIALLGALGLFILYMLGGAREASQSRGFGGVVLNRGEDWLVTIGGSEVEDAEQRGYTAFYPYYGSISHERRSAWLVIPAPIRSRNTVQIGLNPLGSNSPPPRELSEAVMARLSENRMLRRGLDIETFPASPVEEHWYARGIVINLAFYAVLVVVLRSTVLVLLPTRETLGWERRERGQCPRCGYPIPDRDQPCSECGWTALRP